MFTVLVIAVALTGLLVRLLVIAHSGGGSDLRIYTYFSRLALHGANPYDSSAHGAIAPVFGNSPPVEVALFTGMLAIHDSPTTLRVLFALSDTALILLVGLCFPRPRQWRLMFIVFYAFNPFVLFAWTTLAEDKTLLLLGLAVLVLSVERGRVWTAWLATSALAVLKFLGTFMAPVLALDTYRRRGRWVMVPVAAFLALLVLSNLPWFPDSLHAFSRRNARVGIDPPIHASPTLVLSRLGVYAPIEAKLLSAVALLVVVWLVWRRTLDTPEGIVFSLVAGYAFLPDDALDRLLLISLAILLITKVSLRGWAALWLASCLAALAAVVAIHGVPGALSFAASPMRSLFSHESTIRHVVWMNLVPAVVLALYIAQRRARSNAAAIAS